MSQAFFASQQCNQAGLPAPATNLTRNALGQPMCGSNNPTATCLQDMCCSLNGFCGPILNERGVYEANGQVLSREKAFDLYCNNAQGDWRAWTARGECKTVGLNYPRSATTSGASSQEVPTVPPTPAAGDSKSEEAGGTGQTAGQGGPSLGVWIGAAAGAIVLGVLVAMFLIRRRRQQTIGGGGEVKVITSTPPPAQAAPRDYSGNRDSAGGKDDPLCIPLSPGAAQEFYNKRASSASASASAAYAQQQQQQQQQQQPAQQAQRISVMQQQQPPRMSIASGRPISALAVDDMNPDDLVLADVVDVNAQQRFSNQPPRPQSAQSGHSVGAFPVALPPSNASTPVPPATSSAAAAAAGRPPHVTSMMSAASSSATAHSQYSSGSSSNNNTRQSLMAPMNARPGSHMSTTMAAPHLPPMPSTHANAAPTPATSASLSPTELAPSTAAPGLPEYFAALRQYGSGNLGPRVAVHAFVPTRTDEMEVRAGDTVYVEHAFADGWARGHMGPAAGGLFPLGVVAPAGPHDHVVVALHNDMARMAALQPDQVVPLTPGGHVWAGPTPRTASFKRLSRV